MDRKPHSLGAEPGAIRETLIVFVHVFHADVWAEMAKTLADVLNRPFALVLTTPDPDVKLVLPQTSHLRRFACITTENRGRDVLPFLTALREVGPHFDIGLKLHTKRSVHRGDGDAWRRFILNSLLEPAKHHGGSHREPAALKAMETIPSLGLVAPRFHLMPLTNRIALNRRLLKTILLQTDSFTPLSSLRASSFAAGTMFWFRRKALSPLLERELDPLFVGENAQLDGTAAHALERLFAYIVEAGGYVATGGEALDAIAERGVSSGWTVRELQALNRRALSPADNPFLVPFRPFWAEHPYLFEAYATFRHYTFERVAEHWKARRTRRLGG